MSRPETELEMVERHVQEGKLIVARQRRLVRRLLERSASADLAGTLLAEFRAIQRLHKAHLTRIARQTL